MAELRGIADLGMVSLLIAHQTTLGDALSVLTQFRNRINTNLALRIEEYDDLVMLRESFVFDPPMPSRQADDLALGVLEQMCGAVLGGSWKPVAICLPYERPPLEELRVFQRMFSSPIEFNAEFEGILLNRSDLELSNPRADPAMAQHARNLVNSIIDPGERSVVQEVEQAIQILLPSGRASIGSGCAAGSGHVGVELFAQAVSAAASPSSISRQARGFFTGILSHLLIVSARLSFSSAHLNNPIQRQRGCRSVAGCRIRFPPQPLNPPGAHGA